jgi:SAM-dependent methyltransferase
MTITITNEMAELKAAHKVTWDSGNYAAIADAFVLEVGETAVAKATLGPGRTVLDVATGSGSAAIPAALTGADVTGLDLAPSLLEVARERAAEAGAQVEWVEGDAEALPFDDESFDTVLSAIGVQFAPRHEIGASELARVTRAGGEIVVCSWTPAGFIGQVFKTMGPHMPKPPEGAAPPPLWGSEEHVSGLFAETGVELEFEKRSVSFEHTSPESFVEFMADNYGPMLKAREKLSPDGRWEVLRSELIELCERSNTDGRAFSAPSEYLVIHGRKAGS